MELTESIILQFNTPIRQLFVSDGTLYVLFSTGHVEMVSEAIKSRKEKKTGFLPTLSCIRHAELIKGTKVLILVVESEVRAIEFCVFYSSGV